MKCMDKLASVTIVTGPATFIIPFSGLLSSNISRGSCFSSASVEHTSRTKCLNCFSEIFPGKWKVKKRLRQFFSPKNDSIYNLWPSHRQKRLKFIKTFVGQQHFNCLVNGAQNIRQTISLYSCGALNQMFWWWWQRNTKNIFFLEKVEINECFGLLSARVSAEQTLLTMCHDDDWLLINTWDPSRRKGKKWLRLSAEMVAY